MSVARTALSAAGGPAPTRRPHVRTETLPDGSAVLFEPSRRITYALTASAALVWTWCDGATAPATLVERLAEVFDAPAAQIARDVAALLEHLTELNLVIAAEQGAS